MEQYKLYKDSGVNWISDIPVDWSIKRVKDVFVLERGKFTHRPRNDQKMFINGIYPFIQTGDITKAKKYVKSFKQKLNENGIKVSKEFKKGTIVMSIAANIGDVAILDFDCYFPDSIVAFKTKYNVDYFFYLLSSDKSSLDNVKITNTQDNINLERLNSLEKIFPPIGIQNSIATYLNKKTDAISRKVDLLHKKIDYYKDLRIALIKKITNQGLDNNVELVKSPLPWLDRCPSHWQFLRGKEIIKENIKSKISANDGLKKGKYKFFTSSDIQSKWLDYYTVNEESILFSTGGMAGVNYCDKEYSYSTDCWSVQIEKYHTKYYYYYYQSIIYEIGVIGFKGAGLEHLQKDFIKQGLVPVFSKQEQIEITNFLDDKTMKIDKIINNISLQIKHLKELRKTLINEVVTGKVKVTA